MRIVVYDVAAEDGGGLFVLNSFYREVIEQNDPDIEWLFLVSTDEIRDARNVRVICLPETKRSWLSRLRFEYGKLPKLLSELKPDLVISLQNMPVKRCRIRQFVYLHQSLQYCPKKFSLWKGEERGLAIRQKFISFLIKNAMPKAEHIFVQTQWIKDATVTWLKRDPDEITIVPVSVNADGIDVKPYTGADSKTFFYPARPEIYKNHRLIIEACRILRDRGITDYKVIFSAIDQTHPSAQRLIDEAKGLPIECIGSVPHEEIFDTYSRTILVFPSYLETCGIPMLEARLCGAVILASDMPFSHEALDGYPNASFFSVTDPAALADQMQACLEHPTCHPAADDTAAEPASLLASMMLRI